ncbi:MAG: hypothetical protein K9M08_08490 [Pirellula sp.]|nr:hypothetical protein [Pirellula sp.]
MTTATATAETEQDLVIAGLIQQVRGEAELRTRQGEAQQMRQALADELKAVTARINQEIQECNAIDQDSARQLFAIGRAKAELLRSTPEGKQIRAMEAELQELTLVNGVPQLQLLRHQVELAMDQGKKEEAGMIRGRLANLEGKIQQRQSEIDRLWESFGFGPDCAIH